MDRGIDLADGLQHSRHTQTRELARQNRLIPRRRDEAHGGQVVDLIWLGRLKSSDKGGLIQHVSLYELNAVEQMLDTIHRVRTGSARHSDYAIALVEQELGQVRAILAGDAGD